MAMTEQEIRDQWVHLVFEARENPRFNDMDAMVAAGEQLLAALDALQQERDALQNKVGMFVLAAQNPGSERGRGVSTATQLVHWVTMFAGLPEAQQARIVSDYMQPPAPTLALTREEAEALMSYTYTVGTREPATSVWAEIRAFLAQTEGR